MTERRTIRRLYDMRSPSRRPISSAVMNEVMTEAA